LAEEYGATLAFLLGPDIANKTVESQCVPLLIEALYLKPVVRARGHV
jgi:hypothetical protein